MRNLIVTGATGYIGKDLIPKIAGLYKRVYLVVRKESLQRAGLLFKEYSNIELIEGNIEQSYLNSAQIELSEKIDFLHLAAAYDFKLSYADLYLSNIIGTSNVLKWIKELKIDRFFYTSTIAVAGDFQGRLLESDFDKGQGFHNDYASTKYSAEKMVRDFATEQTLGITILRPGVVIGDSKSGAFEKWDGPYYFLKSLLGIKRLLPITLFAKHLSVIPFPFDREARIPLVPVDELTDSIVTIMSKTTAQKVLRCYHLSGVEEGTPIDRLLSIFFQAFGFSCRFIPIKRGVAVNFLATLLKEIPSPLWSYHYQKTIFDQSELKKDFPEIHFTPFERYSEVIINGAKSRGEKR